MYPFSVILYSLRVRLPGFHDISQRNCLICMFLHKLNSFVALMIQFVCLEFRGQDSDVLQPDPLIQVYVVMPWLTFIIILGWMCHFGFWGLAISSGETISQWCIRHRPWKPKCKNEIWSSHLPVGNRCPSQKPRTLDEITRKVNSSNMSREDWYVHITWHFFYTQWVHSELLW